MARSPGRLTSKRGTGNIISGYLSADKFSFTINIPIEGNPTDVVFTGTFDGTSLKGNIDVMGYTLEFTGVKPTVARRSKLRLPSSHSNKQGFIGRRGCTVRIPSMLVTKRSRIVMVCLCVLVHASTLSSRRQST